MKLARRFLFLMIFLLSFSCLSMGEELISSDGTVQITLLPGWSEDKELHADASLQASSAGTDSYIIVLTDSKEDFEDMTLEKHSEITRASLLESLKSVEVSAPAKMEVGGKSALQYEIRGTMENIRIIYLHTTVETAGSFHQVLAWTVRSKFEKNRETLQKVIASFHERPASR